MGTWGETTEWHLCPGCDRMEMSHRNFSMTLFRGYAVHVMSHKYLPVGLAGGWMEFADVPCFLYLFVSSILDTFTTQASPYRTCTLEHPCSLLPKIRGIELWFQTGPFNQQTKFRWWRLLAIVSNCNSDIRNGDLLRSIEAVTNSPASLAWLAIRAVPSKYPTSWQLELKPPR